MSNAKHDANSRPTIICVSNADGETIVPIWANGGLMVNNAHTGSDNGNNDGCAMLDENSVSVLTALSSAGDGSIVEIYGDPLTNRLFIDSL